LVRRTWCVAACLVLAAGVPRPLQGQDQALILSIHGGRHTPVVELSDAGDDLVSAFSFGGSVALQLNPNVALRGMATYHGTRYRGPTVSLTDTSAAQVVAMADLQIGWPGTSALVPYIYFGAGAVVTDFKDPAHDLSTRFGGRFGVGINRVSGLGAWFLEVGGLLYEFNTIGLKRIQFDVETRLGYALALGL
jgi:hypothetical protein